MTDFCLFFPREGEGGEEKQQDEYEERKKSAAAEEPMGAISHGGEHAACGRAVGQTLKPVGSPLARHWVHDC